MNKYLDVRYDVKARPMTQYPDQLITYLSELYVQGDFQKKKLLDIGSGRGEFTESFRKLGFDAHAVDQFDYDETPFQGEIVQCDFSKNAFPYEDGQFDVLFNKSVLEHVVDTSHMLNEMHRVMSDDGLVISMVPDWHSQWYHFYDDWTHVNPFTLIGLREAFLCHGFEVIDARKFFQLPWAWKIYDALQARGGKGKWLEYLLKPAQLVPYSLKNYSKNVRFAKELMLLVVAKKK